MDCLGSGWLVGLRRLLRGGDCIPAPCGCEQGVNRDQVREHSSNRTDVIQLFFWERLISKPSAFSRLADGGWGEGAAAHPKGK